MWFWLTRYIHTRLTIYNDLDLKNIDNKIQIQDIWH